MSKKKKTAKAASSISGVVVPFVPKQDEFNNNLDVFRAYPSLPVLFAVLESAVDAGINLELVLAEIHLLTNASEDQFYGSHGSKFFNKNYKLLDAYRDYRTSEQGVIWSASQIWKLLGRFRNGVVVQYEDYLVGDVDYYALLEAEEEIKPEPETLDTQGHLLVGEHLEMLTDAIKSQKQHTDNVMQITDSLGCGQIPYAVWSYEILADRKDLSSGVSDLSMYLTSYFSDKNDLDIPELGFRANQTFLKHDQSLVLAKIASFVLFEPLMRKVVYEGKSVDHGSFFEDRIKYLSEIDALETPEDRADYITAITNLQLICAKLEVDSVKSKLVSAGERLRSYFDGIDKEHLSAACLVPLPPSGFSQVIAMYNPWEGDEEYLSIYRLLKISGYGFIRSYNRYEMDDLFETVFKGLDKELVRSIKKVLESSVKRWVIPLFLIRDIPHFYDGFFDDDEIANEISTSLIHSDIHRTPACLFDRQDIDGITMQPYSFSKEMHPAIFARKFCNREDFMDFSDEAWLQFADSLLARGMTRYACVLLTLFLNMKAVKDSYTHGHVDRLNIPRLTKIFNRLSTVDSFGMVRLAIKDYLDVTQEDFHLQGSLTDYLPLNKKSADIVPLKQSFANREDAHRKSLLEIGVNIDGLCKEAESSLVKGHMLLHDHLFSQANLSKEALTNYYWAVESELRSRIPVLNETVSEELKMLGIDIKLSQRVGDRPGKVGEILGLGGISRLLNAFNRLSEGAKLTLGGVRALANHESRGKFISNLNEIATMRNVISHPKRIQSTQVDEFLAKTEELIFGSGSMLEVLRETS